MGMFPMVELLNLESFISSKRVLGSAMNDFFEKYI